MKETPSRFTGAVLTLLCLAGLALGAEGLTQTLEIGAPAPDFNLPGVDGRNHALKGYADAKLLMVVFIANHCKTAQAYEERIIGLVTDYRDRGVAVVAIAPNDPQAVSLSELVAICADAPDRKDRALALLKERQVAARNYIMAKEDNDALSAALDPEWPGGFPYSILVAPGGKILQRQMGEIDAMKLKKVIALCPGR